MVRQHHERLDGSGYPNGLKGDQICPEARVLAVADTIEAMATHRPGRGFSRSYFMEEGACRVRDKIGCKGCRWQFVLTQAVSYRV